MRGNEEFVGRGVLKVTAVLISTSGLPIYKRGGEGQATIMKELKGYFFIVFPVFKD